MNLTVLANNISENFEVFDLRDGLNVVAYSVMSISKYVYIYVSLVMKA